MSEKEKSIKIHVHKIKETLSYLFSETWKYDKSFFVFYGIDIAANSIAPFVNIIFPKFIIDEFLGYRDLNRIVWLIAIMIGLNFMFGVILAITSENLSKKYYDIIQYVFDAKIRHKMMQMNYESTEDKKILEETQKARYGLSFSAGGFQGVIRPFSEMFTGLITLLGTVSLILANSPLLVLLVVINVAINSLLNRKKNKLQLANFKILSSISRAYDYLTVALSDIRYGKDIRLYHAEEMMLTKADHYNDEQTSIIRKQFTDIFKFTRITNLNMAVTAGLSYLYLGYLGLTGSLSIGDFAMMATASTTFLNSINSISNGILAVQNKCNYAYEYVHFMKSRKYIPEEGKKELNDTRQCIIEFKNVSFTYPGSEKETLKNISLRLQDGEHLSIVGLNGSGKTTLIKLLCRLYKVTKGEILLNGTNILDYDFNEYIKLISVVFQDFKLMPFTLKENITMENTDKIKDEELDELLKKTGLDQKVKDLDLGLHTFVFKNYDKAGFEPSGGEQQKIAIARALFKDAPMVILDEPTAALDPIAEYEIYRQFNDLVNNKTAIYISHRLSSCKFCDKIAVLSDGMLSEYGTHEELLRKSDGLYAKMFHAQAQYYV